MFKQNNTFMRKVLGFGTTFLFFCNSYASTRIELPILKADQLFISIGKSGQKISYAQLAIISISDLQALAGRKMNFIQKVNFRTTQSMIRTSIANDGTIKNKKIAKVFSQIKEGGNPFHLGGFALGFFAGPIGVLIAYLFKDRYKRTRIKWAWIGCGAFVLWIILVAVIFSTA